MLEIKLVLMGRLFPIKVSDDAQATRVQEAAILFNNRMVELREKYPQVDELILLLMGGLDLATDVYKAKEKQKELNEQLNLAQQELNDLYLELDKIFQSHTISD